MTFEKRRKEAQRSEQKREKLARRQARRIERARKDPPTEGVDPDIAHIVPGPQPEPPQES